MTTTTWSQTHTAFDNGSMAKVHTLGTLSVLSTRNLQSGAEGWTFLYAGLFAQERHDGFRTMAAAKAAAVAYITTPVAQAHAAADAFRAA